MIFPSEATSLPGNGMVSDGRSRFALAELRAALPRWAEWLERQGVARNDCIVLPVRTDACSAAALLALLLHGQSLLLWRQSLMEHGGRIVGSDLPGFCRYALIAAPGTGSAPAITDPHAFRLAPLEDGRASPVANSSWVYLATSGTTGKPKIVAYTHSALLGNAGNCRGRLGITDVDRVIDPVPLAHVYGLGAALLPAVEAGASIR